MSIHFGIFGPFFIQQLEDSFKMHILSVHSPIQLFNSIFRLCHSLHDPAPLLRPALVEPAPGPLPTSSPLTLFGPPCICLLPLWVLFFFFTALNSLLSCIHHIHLPTVQLKDLFCRAISPDLCDRLNLPITLKHQMVLIQE